MNATTVSPPEVKTLADLLERLGGIQPVRIPARPAPGTATEADVLPRPGGEKRLYELVDGVLVEKPMGFYESRLAAVLVHLVQAFLEEHDLGIVLSPDGTMRLAPGLVRLPDVSIFRWERFPDRELPNEAVPDLAPDLAIEILSKGNTEREMQRKVGEYFAAGTKAVWLVDPATRSTRIYSSPQACTSLGENEPLGDDALLPGFAITLREWLHRAGRRAE